MIMTHTLQSTSMQEAFQRARIFHKTLLDYRRCMAQPKPNATFAVDCETWIERERNLWNQILHKVSMDAQTNRNLHRIARAAGIIFPIVKQGATLTCTQCGTMAAYYDQLNHARNCNACTC